MQVIGAKLIPSWPKIVLVTVTKNDSQYKGVRLDTTTTDENFNKKSFSRYKKFNVCSKNSVERLTQIHWSTLTAAHPALDGKERKTQRWELLRNSGTFKFFGNFWLRTLSSSAWYKYLGTSLIYQDFQWVHSKWSFRNFSLLRSTTIQIICEEYS